MAMIDFGAMLKVNGNFVNKNEHFMDIDYCKEPYKNYFVYGGNKNFYICFYKTTFVVVKNGESIKHQWGCDFAKETFNFDETTVTIEPLDWHKASDLCEKFYLRDKHKTWEGYLNDLYLLPEGFDTNSIRRIDEKVYVQYLHMRAKLGRDKKRYEKRGTKVNTHRYKATWDYKEKHYEVIYGYGIDPSEEVWNKIKTDEDYNFTEKEIKIIDEWFGIDTNK